MTTPQTKDGSRIDNVDKTKIPMTILQMRQTKDARGRSSEKNEEK